MRFFSLFAVLILSLSCGKNDNGGTSTFSKTQGVCDLDGSNVACESIKGADGLGIDYLESAIDVPVKIQNSEITFLADKTSSSQGRRISCKLSVKNGEVYRFALKGDRLSLTTNEGSFDMERLSEGEGLGGAWLWKGYVEQGVHMIRSITFIGNDRMILRNNCEL